jgi:predicted site-specific integrase-resolvase
MDSLLTPQEVAAILRIETQTLAKWRTHGRGPEFVAINGSAIRYRQSALDRYLNENTLRMTRANKRGRFV